MILCKCANRYWSPEAQVREDTLTGHLGQGQSSFPCRTEDRGFLLAVHWRFTFSSQRPAVTCHAGLSYFCKAREGESMQARVSLMPQAHGNGILEPSSFSDGEKQGTGPIHPQGGRNSQGCGAGHGTHLWVTTTRRADKQTVNSYNGISYHSGKIRSNYPQHGRVAGSIY